MELKAPERDLLRGMTAIVDYVNELVEPPITKSIAVHWSQRGILPTGKLGGQVTASKAKIRDAMRRVSGE